MPQAQTLSVLSLAWNGRYLMQVPSVLGGVPGQIHVSYHRQALRHAWARSIAYFGWRGPWLKKKSFLAGLEHRFGVPA